jgi:hypothetical protein
MKFYMAAGRLAGTQAEAKERDPKFVQHDVPTDKDGLMEYVNGLLDKIASLRNAQPIEEAPRPPVVQPAAAPPPPPAAPAPSTDHAAMRRKLAQELRGMETEAIEERILSLKGNEFARVFCAGVERFGNLGKDAFQNVRGFLEMTPAMHPAYLDGLRMLSLMQIEALGEPKRNPQTYKELNS